MGSGREIVNAHCHSGHQCSPRLALNLKTAKSLELVVSPSILALADEVIE
jgi:hypothetical protein